MNAAAFAMLSCASSAAWAQDVSRAIIVIDDGASFNMEPEVRDAAVDAGVSQLTFMSEAELTASVRQIAVDGLDPGCVGVVPRASWDGDLSAAEDAVQLLDFGGAMSLFESLERDMGCLEEVVERQGLQRMHLVQARAMLLAARMAPPEEAEIYTFQAQGAVDAARSLGSDLLMPVGLEVEIEQMLQRDLGDEQSSLLVAAAGPSGQVFLDGALLGSEPLAKPSGRHLLQVERGGRVVASQRVTMASGSTLVWAGPYSDQEIDRSVESVASGEGGSDLLTAVSALMGEALLVAHVSPDGEVSLYQTDGSLLETAGRRGLGKRVEMTVRAPDVDPEDPGASVYEDASAVDGASVDGGYADPAAGANPANARVGTWAWSVGAGGAASVGDLAYGPVDLVARGSGASIWGRYVIDGDWTAALSVQPQFRVDLLPVHYDDVWERSAWTPIRLGARYGRPSVGRSFEVGADVVTHVLGRYDDARRLRAGLALAGGTCLPLFDNWGLRIEGYVAGGPSWWWSSGLNVGFERAVEIR